MVAIRIMIYSYPISDGRENRVDGQFTATFVHNVEKAAKNSMMMKDHSFVHKVKRKTPAAPL